MKKKQVRTISQILGVLVIGAIVIGLIAPLFTYLASFSAVTAITTITPIGNNDENDVIPMTSPQIIIGTPETEGKVSPMPSS